MRNLLLGAALLLPAALPAPSQAATAWVSSNHIQVIDLDTAQIVGRIPLKEFIHDMEFSPDGARVYVASSHGLRIADAVGLQFTHQLAQGSTLSVSVSGDGASLVALEKGDDDAALAARKAGQPLPVARVTVYAAGTLTATATWEVPGTARDVLLARDGSAVYVLEPAMGQILVFGADGAARESIDVAPGPRAATGHAQAIYSSMEMSPDGSRVLIPTTSEAASSVVDVSLSGERAERVIVQDLGHRRRIQGVAWDEDGSGMYVTAVNNVVKFTGAGEPVSWAETTLNYVDVAPVPGTAQTVMVAPTFSSARRSGGVSLLDGNGSVVRSVELPDMSPFHVAVSPR